MDIYKRVHGNLNKLGLSVTEEAIDSYLETSYDRGVMEILDHLLDQEVKNLNSRHVEIRMRYSGIPFRKTMEMFDFSFQPSIDRSLMDDLMTLRYRNVIT